MDLNSGLGSYSGDLWDVALDTCGYSISNFRKGSPRKAFYTAKYSRRDFEKLWEGREDRCPYWDDEEWHSPEDHGHKTDQGDQQGVICLCYSNYGCRWFADGMESSEASDDSETEPYELDSDVGSADIESEDVPHDTGPNEDGREEQRQFLAGINGSKRTPHGEEYTTDWDSSDHRTHHSPHLQHEAHMQTPQQDELSHNPWLTDDRS